MEFYVEQKVLDAGVKLVCGIIRGVDNNGDTEEWTQYRTKKIKEFYEAYQGFDVHADPIIEGYNILHDNTGVKRRKNIPSTQNLIKILEKSGDIYYISRVVDIYNVLSLDNKLSYGAHDMRFIEGNITLRFTDGTERFVPLGQPEPKAINSGEYSYCDDSNEVLCRLEIRQVEKTAIQPDTTDIALLVQGNEATTDEYVKKGMEDLIEMIEKYCGGKGEVIMPTVI